MTLIGNYNVEAYYFDGLWAVPLPRPETRQSRPIRREDLWL